MPKRHKPIKIKSPTSDNHVVRLFPRQEAIITFKGEHATPTVLGEFLTVEEVSKHKFKISQTHDMTPWQEELRLFLGEIKFDLNSTKKVVALSFVLETDKKDGLTVINPKDANLKVTPTQLVEVILCSNKIDRIDCAVTDGEEGVKPVLVHKISIQRSDSKEVWFEGQKVMGRCFWLEDETKFEHHFWFRYSVSPLAVFQKMNEGTYNGGKLVFDIHSDNAICHNAYSINLIVSIRNKKGRLIVEPTDDDVRKFGKQTKQTKPTVTAATVKKKAHVVSAEDDYSPRKVILEPKESGDLDAGCKVIFMKDFTPTPAAVTNYCGAGYVQTRQHHYSTKKKRGVRWNTTTQKWDEINVVNDTAMYDEGYGG